MDNKVISQWNLGSKKYLLSQEASEYVKVNREIVEERFSKASVGKMLDLGCGYGYYTDFFRSLGWDAIGCDGSVNMLSLAKDRYPLCTFELVDVLRPLPYEDGSFDLVFSNQVLMDIESLEGPIREMYRVTRPGGIFYMSIVHPAFYDGQWEKDENGYKNGKTIKRYLTEYRLEDDLWGKTTHFHRPLSKYFNTITHAGYRLKSLCEPVTYDGVVKTKEIPLFLFAEFQK